MISLKAHMEWIKSFNFSRVQMSEWCNDWKRREGRLSLQKCILLARSISLLLAPKRFNASNTG